MVTSSYRNNLEGVTPVKAAAVAGEHRVAVYSTRS
jgi:hypothetical protein